MSGPEGAGARSPVGRRLAPALLATVDGPIRRVLLTLPFWVVRYRHQPEIAPFAAVFEALLRDLPPGAERVVVTHRESEGPLRSWLAEAGSAGGVRVLPVEDGVEFTVWAQDACLVRRDTEGALRLVGPDRFERFQDAPLLERVARALGAVHERAPLAFQAGNVLVGDDFWLAGADIVQRTVAVGLAPDVAAAETTLADLDRTRTLHLVGTRLPVPLAESRTLEARAGGPGGPWSESLHRGNAEGTRQPLFDLDTFIALAGRDPDGAYRLLVGDPRLAAELAGAPLASHSLADHFDDVAAHLAGSGFRVVRNPLPLVHSDDGPTRTRIWYFASSNNVLAEVDGDRRSVWLPTYEDDDHPALAATDRRNRELWEEAGFRVHPLPSFHAFAQGLGAAHCICKCLAR